VSGKKLAQKSLRVLGIREKIISMGKIKIAIAKQTLNVKKTFTGL
jgi:hypothetical protein